MGISVAHPQSGSSSTVSGSNWNLEMLVFVEGGKPEYPEKNLSEQGREPTTNQPRYDVNSGNQTRATLMGGECSPHCAIPAPPSLKDFSPLYLKFKGFLRGAFHLSELASQTVQFINRTYQRISIIGSPLNFLK